MIGTLWAMFGSAGLVAKLITVGAILLALITVYGVWHHKVYTKGWNGAIAAIARQDKGAIEDAQKKRSAFKACRAQGMKWDQTTGGCS